MEGYIKTFRKKLEWRWFRDPSVAHLFEYLTLRANYSDKEWKDTIIRRGQLISSREKMSEETGLSVKIVRRCLNALKRTGEISIDSNNQYSLITINKYSMYQGESNTEGQQKASGSPTTGQQRATNIEYKNENKTMRSSLRSDMSPEATQKSDKQAPLDFDAFVVYFNGKVKDTQVPTIIKLNKFRKGLLSARLKEYGKESLAIVVEKVIASTFLTGGTGQFVAKFDWIFSPKNFPKILEGNYDNTLNQRNSGYESNSNRGFAAAKPTMQERIKAELREGAEYFNSIDETGGAGVSGGVPQKVW